jgi:hypothetical protein
VLLKSDFLYLLEVNHVIEYSGQCTEAGTARRYRLDRDRDRSLRWRQRQYAGRDTVDQFPNASSSGATDGSVTLSLTDPAGAPSNLVTISKPLPARERYAEPTAGD